MANGGDTHETQNPESSTGKSRNGSMPRKISRISAAIRIRSANEIRYVGATATAPYAKTTEPDGHFDEQSAALMNRQTVGSPKS